MTGGWRYRIASVVGTFLLAAGAVVVASHPLVQTGVDALPVLGDLPLGTASGRELATEAIVAATVVTVSLWPLLKPQPRRILDTASIAVQRTLLAMVTLAAIGYFDYTYQLPRATLIVSMAFLVCVLPTWFVAIRRRPREGGERLLVVGDDTATITELLADADSTLVGYVSPPDTARELTVSGAAVPPAGGVTDGGTAGKPQLGGLSQLREVLVTHDIDTVVLAFTEPDRAEFFGALDTCYDYGVQAKVHRRHADSVLTAGHGGGDIVDVELEPWDLQDRILKRLFDVVFAGVGLLVLSPVMVVIAVAIKFEDDGSVFYTQERTAALGDTFDVYKFRSMYENAESESGAKLSAQDAGGVDPRVTRVGLWLRRTHLDEIPQLWSVLVGDMSAVGPRPERPELDLEMENGAGKWRSRWFVKPGLTGLAQVHDATGHNPAEKLRYDVEYIQRQSFWFDLKIVLRQIWMVLTDITDTGKV